MFINLYSKRLKLYIFFFSIPKFFQELQIVWITEIVAFLLALMILWKAVLQAYFLYACFALMHINFFQLGAAVDS